ACHETREDAARDAPLCDPASRQTTRRGRRCRQRDGHREHTSIAARSSSCHSLEPAPAPACRRRATYSRSSRSGAALPPAVPATVRFRPPNPPASSAPVPHPDARTSPIADTAEDGRSTYSPERAPAAPARPDRAQSVGSALRPAQCSHTWCNSAWCARDVSPRNWRARTPASRRHPRLTCATRSDIADTPFLSARACAFVAEDDRVVRGARVSLPHQSKRRGREPVLARLPLARGALVSAPPAATPTARSAAPSSPTCAQTACDAAWPAAVSDARSRAPAIAAVRLWRGVACAAPGSALAAHLREERWDR